MRNIVFRVVSGTAVSFLTIFFLSKLLETVLFINYFFLFLALINFIILRFTIIGRIFKLYDTSLMNKAKDLVIYLKETSGERFLVDEDVIKRYKPGTNKAIDNCLMNIWEKRDSVDVWKYIDEFEKKLSLD